VDGDFEFDKIGEDINPSFRFTDLIQPNQSKQNMSQRRLSVKQIDDSHLSSL